MSPTSEGGDSRVTLVPRFAMQRRPGIRVMWGDCQRRSWASEEREYSHNGSEGCARADAFVSATACGYLTPSAVSQRMF